MSAAPPETSEDSLLGGRVRLLQPLLGYRAAIDPVLLAAAVDPAGGREVLELGCGSGAASLCLLRRCPELRVTGLEIDPQSAALARRSAALNGLEDRFRAVEGDLLAPPPELVGLAFDQAICNPPYNRAASATVSQKPGLARAHSESAAVLDDWIAAARRALKPKGRLTLIHRADRLGEILSLLRGWAGEIVVFPLWPGAGRPAKRVLLRARAGVATPMKLAAGLALHDADGGFSPQAETVLRQGAALPLE
ncbi:MAG: methyltransferase [Rhodovibrionaceae bacterium]